MSTRTDDRSTEDVDQQEHASDDVSDETNDETQAAAETRTVTEERREHVVVDETADEDGPTFRWGAWSPAQIVVAVLGGFLIVLGVLALSNTGFGEWTSPETSVWGFTHTPLMAVIEIAIGLIILMATPSPYGARGTLVGFGVLMSVFGIITLLDATAFNGALGVNRQMGLLYTASGLGATVLGFASPVIE